MLSRCCGRVTICREQCRILAATLIANRQARRDRCGCARLRDLDTRSYDMNANIVIMTGNHLCHNPRVTKEAAALMGAGNKVSILGAWFDSGLKQRDQQL